jgi:hypothetical protein
MTGVVEGDGDESAVGAAGGAAVGVGRSGGAAEGTGRPGTPAGGTGGRRADRIWGTRRGGQGSGKDVPGEALRAMSTDEGLSMREVVDCAAQGSRSER